MADSKPTPSPIPTPLPRSLKTSIVPNGRPGKWDTIQLGIRLGCVVLLTGAVVGFFCLSGKAITVEQIILIVVAGGALAGLAAAPRSGGGSGTTLLGGGMMMLMLMGCAGCGAGPIVPDPNPGDGVEPCEVEASIVDSLATAVDDVDEAVPDDAPKAVDGLAYARGVVEAGRAAVGTCRALTADGHSGLSAVLPWLSAASSMVRAIISIIMAAHVDIPESVRDVLHMLGLARATVPPIERDPPYTPAYYDVAVAR